MTLLEVIEQIVPSLELDRNINAMWVEGSWATGKNNENSDIDIWLDVNDNTFTECIDAFRRELTTIGAIDWEQARGVYSHTPRLQKQTFHLSTFPEPQRIELDLQEHSRNFMFSKNEHVIKVLFDKNGTIQWKDDQ